MSQERKPTLGFFIAVTIVVVVATPVFYVLLTGPLVFLVSTGVVGDGALDLVIVPIDFLWDYIPVRVTIRIDHYMTWWDELAQSVNT